MNAEEWRRQGSFPHEEEIFLTWGVAKQRKELEKWLTTGAEIFRSKYGELDPLLLEDLKKRGFIVREKECLHEDSSHPRGHELVVWYIFE